MFNFDFIGKRKYFFTLSISLFVIILLFTLFKGVDLAIEFKGGTFINYAYSGKIDYDEFSSVAEESAGTKADVTSGTDLASNQETIKVSFSTKNGLTADKQFELTQKLQEKFPDNNLDVISSSDVNPSSGKEFFQKCLLAVAFASIVLIIYIAWRFKRISGWSAGVFAILGLFHDVIMVYGTFVIFGIPINANFMAVVLTILGYSINDTIVVYDRIRENKKILGKKTPVAELVNTSINQSLTRTINTSIATISTMIIVSIVAVIFKVESILSFSFPLIIGMIFGVYSTIFITGPLWVLWQEYKEKNKKSYADK